MLIFFHKQNKVPDIELFNIVFNRLWSVKIIYYNLYIYKYVLTELNISILSLAEWKLNNNALYILKKVLSDLWLIGIFFSQFSVNWSPLNIE